MTRLHLSPEDFDEPEEIQDLNEPPSIAWPFLGGVVLLSMVLGAGIALAASGFFA